MKIFITDPDVLRNVHIDQIEAYLSRQGWRLLPKEGWIRARFWRKESGDGAWEVLVPDAETYGDYHLRVSELLADLALHEGRTELAVLQAIEGGTDPSAETWTGSIAPRALPAAAAAGSGHAGHSALPPPPPASPASPASKKVPLQRWVFWLESSVVSVVLGWLFLTGTLSSLVDFLKESLIRFR